MSTNSSIMIKPALQTIVNGNTGKVIGYEVLARWTDGWPNSSIILEPSKRQFFKDWNQADKAVIEALTQSAEHMSKLEERFFINVSQETLENNEKYAYWKDKLMDLLWLVNLPITIEIVEDVEDDTLLSRWGDLERLGVTLALDDFGKKNSTLDRLQRYEWSFCKIDIQDNVIKTEALEFCNSNSISIIAEKVESEKFSQKAFEYGLDQHQGFLYGLPFFLREVETNESMV